MKNQKTCIKALKSFSLTFLALSFFVVFMAVNPGVHTKADTVVKGINVKSPTQQEIKARIESIENKKTQYATEPLLEAPYSAGTLTEETLQNAMDWMNAVRFIAGIPDDVTLNSTYNEKTQASSIVNFANDSLSHNPSQPSGMSDELYQLGLEGSGSSNIAAGWGSAYKNGCSFYDIIVHSWMEDADSSNIPKVGHRRWILNPSMKQTGFGCVWGSGNYGGKYYSAMYAFDNSFGATDYYGVAWPAQNMPISFFGTNYPWSISMGREVSDDATVTLTRVSDSKQWVFSKGSKDFYVENSNYGKKGCIIFRPDEITGYAHGDTFEVVITGTDLDVAYTVNFFDPEQVEEESYNEDINTVVTINETSFKDEIFREYVSSEIDKDGSGGLSKEEIENCTFIDLAEEDVESLEGIEYFTNLQHLDCSDTLLTSLNLCENTALKRLECYRCNLTSINLSNNDDLEFLDCSINQLLSLDVSGNPELTELYCDDNLLTELDLSKNTELVRLDCSWNELTGLDVSGNLELINLYCANNQLTELIVSSNTALEYLSCGNNQLTGLDLKENKNLKILECSSNALTGLNVSANTALTELVCDNNKIASLDLSQNPKLYELKCFGNLMSRINIGSQECLVTTYLNGTKEDGDYTEYCYAVDAEDEDSDEYFLSIDKNVKVLIGTSADQKYIYIGDINDDDEINAKDVTLLRRYLAGGWNVVIIEENSDINGDGTIDAKDVTMLRRYLAGGWGVELPGKGKV